MVSAIVLINLLLASVAFATHFLEAGIKRRHVADGRQSNTNQYLEAPVRKDGPITYNDNWAGAVYHDVPGTFTLVSGVFTLPTPTGSGSATVWVGIDGSSCRNALFQAGVEFNVTGGKVSYGGWYEWLPEPMQYFPESNITFEAGDVIRVTVSASSHNSGTAIIYNVSKQLFVTQPIESSYSLCLQDAEWVVEDYTEKNGALAEFNNFTTVVFSSAVTTTAKWGTIGPGGASIMDIQKNFLPVTSTSVDSTSVTIRHL